MTDKTTVVSPDLGGLKMASAYAEALGANLAIVAKERKTATETEALYLIGDVEDSDVLLVDDLTETAGTLSSAAEIVKRHGARNIYAGVSHAVLVDVAIPRLQKSEITELVTTNSTPVRTVEGLRSLCYASPSFSGKASNGFTTTNRCRRCSTSRTKKMAKQVKLKAEPRSTMGRSAVRKLKARGFIPAVIYGGNDKPQPLQVSARDINAMMSQASGENILVELEIGDDGQSRTALVQEVQHSPVRREIRHVDFHAISMDQMIQAEVPLEPLGTAVGVKTFGGLLEQSLRALAIECLPVDLPDRITVDISTPEHR